MSHVEAKRRPMKNMSELCRLEQSDSGLAFRERLYRKSEISLLVRDVLALANARVSGQRLLVVGVRDIVGGERAVVGVDRLALLQFRKAALEILAQAIEPALNIRIESETVEGKLVAVMMLENCVDPPYLVATPIEPRLPVGIGFVRRGTRISPLKRADLKSMFLHSGEQPLPDRPLRVRFKQAQEMLEEICLPVLPIVELPSERAASRLRAMLESKQLSRDLLGRTETQMSRLMFARVYGTDIPFESHTDESLMQRLSRTTEDYRGADDFYRYELRAHSLQFFIVNESHREYRNVRVKLDVQRIDGIGFSDRHYREDGAETVEYPRIETFDKRFSFEVDLPRIRGGSSQPLFADAPRFWAREAADGKSVIVDFRIDADDLATPISDTLIIHLRAERARV
jgi:Schlafen, AlbA_2